MLRRDLFKTVIAALAGIRLGSGLSAVAETLAADTKQGNICLSEHDMRTALLHLERDKWITSDFDGWPSQTPRWSPVFIGADHATP